jgi:hypothetical protein
MSAWAKRAWLIVTAGPLVLLAAYLSDRWCVFWDGAHQIVARTIGLEGEYPMWVDVWIGYAKVEYDRPVHSSPFGRAVATMYGLARQGWRFGLGVMRPGKILRNWLLLRLVRLSTLSAMFFAALVGRYRRKKIDIGLGPEPMINNVYHKRALAKYGYTAETFVNTVYYITEEFDYRADRLDCSRLVRWLPFLKPYIFYVHALAVAWRQFTRYRCVYFYFQGGQLGHVHGLPARAEPALLRLARVKTVVMPFGGDVHDLSRCPNLLFKHAMATDYPGHRHRRQDIALRIDRWTQKADHVISGCDWVDYMFHWDTLMLGHFSIDVDQWRPQEPRPCDPNGPLRILHAPNHRAIKGSQFFQRAVDELRAEGVHVELVILERVPNSEVQKVMATVDVVADQLIIGWYAMFALEAMAMGLPVLCYIREDLERLYVTAGLLESGELPLVKCAPESVKDVIRGLVEDRARLAAIGAASRAFVERHHSLETVGAVFDGINRSIGVCPSHSPGDAAAHPSPP